MSFSRVMALAARIIQQVLRDRRTLALIFLVPLLIMSLLYLVLTNSSTVHTLAIVYPTGTGSDRARTLIDSLLPGQDKLHTISISADQVFRIKLIGTIKTGQCSLFPSAMTVSNR
jgi:ABC-2 type transport system permease protein